MTQNRSSNRSFIVLGLCLVGILLALFYKSLSPSMVVFSNDGPLGAMNQRAVQLPAGFKGIWYDLNSIGSSGGTFLPDLSQGLFWLLGALYFSKWFVPVVALFLGLCAWVFFRQLKLSALTCVLGGLAAALNSDFFSTACWGVGAQTIGFGFDFLALAALVGTPPRWPWLRFPLAGLAVGMGVTEAVDIGAIFSVFVAAFVLYHAWVSEPTPARRVGVGIARLALVAGFAAFIAAQTISVQIGTAIKGVAGAEETQEAKAARWEWATQWSLPKREALSLMVPGLFGYRMDTPNGGNYWGAAGRDAAWDRYFKGGQEGPPPGGFIRYAGGGVYAGVLVVLVAIWAGIQSLRREGSDFSPGSRKLIWFWLGVMLVSLLLAFGRYAPFYRLFYALPHASAIRNPAKFLHVFSWALIIVFAYGIHGLSRRYLEVAAAGTKSLAKQQRNWWAKVEGFDRKWIIGCALAIGASLLGWLIYASARKGMVTYHADILTLEGRRPEDAADMAEAISSFSLRAVGWYVLFLILAVGSVTLVVSGWFAGRRAKWAGILLGVLLVADLGRANLPWIIYWNYKQKYATNPVIDFLRDKPYEHRVAIFPMKRFLDVSRLPREAAPLVRLNDELSGLYGLEWQQHVFLYYNIQCLDIIQEPRMATDKAAFESALAFVPLRRWELTNTRYLLAPTALLDFLNRQIDPAQQRFRIAEKFDIEPKPGVANPSRYEDLTASLNTNGQCAVFEFNGALPRAKLYADWQVSTNAPAKLQDWVKQLQQHLPAELGAALAVQNPTDLATLKELAEPSLNPEQTVLLAEPVATAPGTNQNAGEVKYESYAPTQIVLRAKARTLAVLLLNDKFDPNWKVLVDGNPEKLLRCNFIMRGVYLKPGDHTIEFKFEPPITALYVTVSAIGVGVILLGCLIFGTRRESAKAPGGATQT